jgi:hypothetical protein
VSGAQHPDDGYLAAAETGFNGRKEYKSNCTAIDTDSKQPMILMKGLIVTQLDDEDEPYTSENDPKHRSWNTCWKPDPELLSLEETGKLFGTSGGLLKYLNTLAHKNPSMKMLEIGPTVSRYRNVSLRIRQSTELLFRRPCKLKAP